MKIPKVKIPKVKIPKISQSGYSVLTGKIDMRKATGPFRTGAQKLADLNKRGRGLF